MKYILDFDEVLFNTTALKEKMDELAIPESERGSHVFKVISEKDPSFDFGELLFPNARAFLKEFGNNCIIVSSATSENGENNLDSQSEIDFQTKKII
ncbi:hypothetical protein N8083_01165, partial [Candidatus Pacebacteria bacterium]|nr:hypothetical protein [Candidatus Paceibacterota bacterium]